MLLSLSVENIALIKKMNIDIHPGFTVLTGETGGGKSIILDSLSLLCGARGDKSLIRTGEDYAVAEGVFDAENSLSGEDCDFVDNGYVSVYRKITSDGRSICKISGQTVSVSKLRQVMEKLLNIHGQQDTQLLSDPTHHIEYLDLFAENEKEKGDYSEEYEVFKRLEAEVSELNKLNEDKLVRLDMLTFSINELEEAHIRVGEQNELEEEEKLLSNYEKIYDNVNLATANTESAADKIRKGIEALSKVSDLLEGLEKLSGRLDSALIEIKDISESLKDSVGIECDSPSERIDEIESRLVTLSHLQRKYRTDEEGLFEKLESFRQEKGKLDMSDELLSEKKALFDESKKRLRVLAAKLTESRKKSAEILEKAIEKHLESLDMPSVTFVTEFGKPETEFTENGSDEVEFLISANAGEEPRPIAKIASGGELSRIMLSIKSALAQTDGVRTVVFDEIDTGISGKTSEKLGMKLASLSQMGIQILCVTHSAQIACQGDTHILVSKSSEDGRTYTSATELDTEGRIKEISRIIGGINITDAVRAAAKELLDKKNKTVKI